MRYHNSRINPGHTLPQPSRARPPRPDQPQPSRQRLMNQQKSQAQPQRPLGIVPPLGELPPLGVRPPEGMILGSKNCLGRESRQYGEEIAKMIRHELLVRQSIINLAAENPGWRLALNDVGEGNLYDARLLSSAYYYITGNIYWPQTIPIISSQLSGAAELQRLTAATDELEQTYTSLAKMVDDPCLAQLYQRLGTNKSYQEEILIEINE